MANISSQNIDSVSKEWIVDKQHDLHVPSVEEAFTQAEKQLDDKLSVTDAIHERATMLIRVSLAGMAGVSGFTLKFVDPSSVVFVCLACMASLLCVTCFAASYVFFIGLYINKGTHPRQWLHPGCIDGNETSYLINKTVLTYYMGEAIDLASKQNAKKRRYLAAAFISFAMAFLALAAIYPTLWAGS